MKWPLWFGILVPVGVVHLVTWMLLFVSPLVIKKRNKADTTSTLVTSWMREAAAIASILFLYELAWGIQLAVLSTTPTNAGAATLQALFILASACLGLVAVLHFCFLQPRERKHVRPTGDSTTSCKDSGPEENSFQEPTTPLSKSSVDTIEVINLVDESEKIVIKLADL